MDPDLVRLILGIFGVLLVVGIYLWDRYKRRTPRPRRVRRVQPKEPSIGEEGFDGAADEELEPSMHEGLEAIPEMHLDADEAAKERAPSARRSRTQLDPDPAEIGEWTLTSGDPQLAMDLNFDAHGGGDYLSTDPMLRDEVERKLVVIHIVAKEGAFDGRAIEQACEVDRLTLGDMSIYHRREGGGGRVLFSMASMVEPGTFPGDDMAGFSTPGLAIFTQLPGVRDGVEVYDEMLATATRIANKLRGELRDERHNKLTRQMEKHMRESIIEHRHRVNLARSRR